MKYLKKFNTETEYNNYINSFSAVLPNVSYCLDSDSIHYNKKINYAEHYFTVIAKEDLTFGMEAVGYSYNELYYSTDNGTTWEGGGTDFSVDVSTGTNILIKGNVISCTTGYGGMWTSGAGLQTFYITADGDYDVEGNLLSLCYSDNFGTYTGQPFNGYSPFLYMFAYDRHLINAKNLILPISSPTGGDGQQGDPFYKDSMYESMFTGCSSLVAAPTIPNMSVGEGTFNNMFASCTSLCYIKCMVVDFDEDTAYDFTDNVSSTGTFVKNSSAHWTVDDDYVIPNGWTVEYADS